MQEALNLATFAWVAFWAVRGARLLAAGARASVAFLLIVFFVFNGLPLLLDQLFGKPEYISYPGLYYATRDELTATIYCLYMIAIPPFWWWLAKPRQPQKSDPKDRAGDTFSGEPLLRLRPLFLALLVSPVVALVFAPYPEIYLNYGWVVNPAIELRETRYHIFVALLTSLSVVAAAGLLASVRRVRPIHFVLLAPWLLAAVWLNGKRFIIVTVVVLIWLVLTNKGYIRRLSSIAAAAVLGLLVLAFSFSYQMSIRHFRGVEELYQITRIEFGRDDIVKMTIFAELNPTVMQILDYRGESLLFYATMLVPRDSWPDKPMPYAVYFTSAVFFLPPTFLGWALTTSWLEEAIANFGWLGFLFGPLVPGLICRVGDKETNEFVLPLTALVASLFITLQFAAFTPIFFVWLAMVVWIRRWPKAWRKAPTPEMLSAAPAELRHLRPRPSARFRGLR